MNEEQILTAKTPGELYNLIEASFDYDCPNILTLAQRQYVWLRAYYWEQYNLKLPSIQKNTIDVANIMDWCIDADIFIDDGPETKISWSKITNKEEISTSLGLSSVDQLNRLAEAGTYELDNCGTRQSWRVRIDGLDPVRQSKLR